MADDLISGQASTTDPLTSPGDAPQSGTPPVEAQPGKTPATNLYEDPNFRRIQSQWEQQQAAMRKEQEALKAQLNELRMRDMDDTQKTQYVIEQLQAQNRALQEQIQLGEIAAQRQADINRMARKFGVSTEELDKFATYEEALEYATDYSERRIREKQKAVANVVDVGGSGSSNASAKSGADLLEQAWNSKDPTAYARALRQVQSAR